MVDGLERSDAQRIAALEARVTELERGNPTCVCRAGAQKREEFPLPWRKREGQASFWKIVDANGRLVVDTLTQIEADRILSIASRLEAAEKVVKAARDAVIEHSPMDCFIRTKMMDALSAYDKSTLAPVDG